MRSSLSRWASSRVGASGRLGLPVGAGVDHGRAEHQLVEVVADVVVVADGLACRGAWCAAGRRRAADLLAGRRRAAAAGPAERDQFARGGPDAGVAQAGQDAGRGSAPVAALPEEPGQLVEQRRTDRPSMSRSPATQARARPSSPGLHSSRRRARRCRMTRTGAPGGPASLPSQARMRTGSGAPSNSLGKRGEPRSGIGHGAHLRDGRGPELHRTTQHAIACAAYVESRAHDASEPHMRPGRQAPDTPKGRPHHGWQDAPSGCLPVPLAGFRRPWLSVLVLARPSAAAVRAARRAWPPRRTPRAGLHRAERDDLTLEEHRRGSSRRRRGSCGSRSASPDRGSHGACTRRDGP